MELIIANIVLYVFWGLVAILFIARGIISTMRLTGHTEKANYLAKKFNVATNYLRY